MASPERTKIGNWVQGSDKVPSHALTMGTGFKEDIQPDKVPRSDPFNINSHALTTRTGLEVIQSDKVPRSNPHNKDSHTLTTRDRDGFEHAPQIHPGKREGRALTKMLVQTGQEVADRKAFREQSKKCWKHNV